MTQNTVDIEVYSNEDLARDFVVCGRDPSLDPATVVTTVAQTIPFDLTGGTLYMQVRNSRGALVSGFDLSTPSTGLSITDATAGKFTLRRSHTVVKPLKGQTGLTYDVLFKAADNSIRRLWGGELIVDPGVTLSP